MNLPKYKLTIEDSFTIFEFVSKGTKGEISKLIKLSETEAKGFYNLAFGDKNSEANDFDDTVISNNGDREKILATVVSAIYIFTDRKKDVWIYIKGCTKPRTRLYRMGIAKYADELRNDFIVLGLFNEEWELYKKDINYDAFLVKRKDANFEL